MADTSHFKSIFQKLQQKLYFVCNVMCFAKIQLCYQQCVIDFVNTTFRPSLKNSLFPVRGLEKVCPPGWLQYFFFFFAEFEFQNPFLVHVLVKLYALG